jgi:hypothetical protein
MSGWTRTDGAESAVRLVWRRQPGEEKNGMGGADVVR